MGVVCTGIRFGLSALVKGDTQMWDRCRRLAGALRRKYRSVNGQIAREDVCLIDARKSGWLLGNTGQLCEGFQIAAEDTVVDVGCGDGCSAKFAARCGAEVIATDVDPKAVDAVEKALRGSKARAYRTVVSDSNPLPIADGVGSKVICTEVLEHVDDPAQVLAELVRVARPGARLMLSVPDPVGESFQRSVAPPVYWEKPNHVRIFERGEFDELVRGAGLEIQNRPEHFFFWSMWWILFWGTNDAHGFEDPDGEEPVLDYWNKTWHALITNPKADHITKALNQFMPKSQVVIARKAA